MHEFVPSTDPVRRRRNVEEEGPIRRGSSPVDARRLESELENIRLNPESRARLRNSSIGTDHSAFSDQNKPSQQPPEPGFFNFFLSEVTRDYALQNDPGRFTEKRRKVYVFLKIPLELEKFLLYGFLQCTDAFLYFFSFLPLRFVVALWHLIFYPIYGQLASSEICDILKVIILVCACVVMQFVDTSVIYHLVRGQAVIKLYIFYNMLEVGDKLFSSFGQDILDALWWTATEPKSSRKMLPHLGTLTHLALAVAYVSLHTFLVLLQATTLNVAFNSHNKALLTIMMSNNFVELKGSVFKKFAKSNLFQMACSDVRERFHYIVLLSIVIIRNMTAVNWKADHFWEMAPDLALVFFAEFLVDWVKHAFITKFNDIPVPVYKDFTITIAYDAMRSRQENAFSDHSDQVSRRMGFIPLPISVLLIRIFTQSLKIQTTSGCILLGLGYIALVLLKTLNSIVLLGRSVIYVERYEALQQKAELLEKMKQMKSKSVPASPKLPLVDFSDIMQQQHRPIKGLTMSDLLQHLSEFELPEPPIKPPPRRTQSTANLTETARLEVILRRQREQSGNSRSPEKPMIEANALEPDLDEPAVSVLNEQQEPAAPSTAEGSPVKKQVQTSECESLQEIDRYTLLNNDRIEL